MRIYNSIIIGGSLETMMQATDVWTCCEQEPAKGFQAKGRDPRNNNIPLTGEFYLQMLRYV